MDFNDDENIEWLMESSKTVENIVEDDVACELGERESNELCQFLELLRSVFESEPVLFASKARGYLRTEDDIQKLMKKLQALGYFYMIRTSVKRTEKTFPRLMIMHKKSPPSAHPYRILNFTQYYCTLGRQCRHKNKVTEKGKTQNNEELMKNTDEEMEMVGANEMKNTNASSGKEVMGNGIVEEQHPKEKVTRECKAVMEIKQMEIFTTIDIPPSRRKQIEVKNKLRRSLWRQACAPGNTKYAISISLPKIHNHAPIVKGQHINEEVKAAMHSLVKTGVRTLPEVQKSLERMVEKDFEREAVKPSKENSAFYPSQKVIYNHLRGDGLIMKRTYLKNVEIETLKRKISEGVMAVIKKIKSSKDRSMLVRALEKVKELETVVQESSER